MTMLTHRISMEKFLGPSSGDIGESGGDIREIFLLRFLGEAWGEKIRSPSLRSGNGGMRRAFEKYRCSVFNGSRSGVRFVRSDSVTL